MGAAPDMGPLPDAGGGGADTGSTFPSSPSSSPALIGTGAGGSVGSGAANDAANRAFVNSRNAVNALRGGFRAGSFELAAPTDRVYVGFNYFNDVPVPGGRPFDIYSETIGVEKTFFDGRASIGLRLPINEQRGASQTIPGTLLGTGTLQTFSTLSGGDGVGDLTVLLKYAIYRDCHCGNVISLGTAVTCPTGVESRTTNTAPNPDGSLVTQTFTAPHSTLVQPFVAVLWNFDRLFVQGFSSVVIPTESNDVSFLANDLAVGFRLYQCNDGLLSAIIPLVEAHVDTPLDHRGAPRTFTAADTVGLTTPIFSNTVTASDAVFLTGGVSFGIANCAYLTLGVVVPVSGPKPYDYQIASQLGLRF
jgi:hypothetical protein